MLEGIFPSACSRLRIFLSYASEHKRIAEELAQALKNEGHDVFFDKDSLAASQDFNGIIRDAVRWCDRFIFLISRSSLQEGRFTLSELQFAKERWPSPKGRVFPVLLDKTIKPEELPVYLRSVQTLSIQGNATAEIAAEIDKTRKVKPFVWSGLVLLLLGMAAAAYGINYFHVGRVQLGFKPPARVDFRPAIAPPDRGGQGDAWLKSALMLSALQFGYENSSSPNARAAQIEPEVVEMKIDGETYQFEYRNEVNLVANCPENNWHCSRQSQPLRSLESGEVANFQSQFRVSPIDKLSWEGFADKVATAQQGVSVFFTPRMKAGGKPYATQVRHECVLDLNRFKTAIAETRQARGRIPIFMQQTCTYR